TKSSKEEGKIEEARQKLKKINDELEKIRNDTDPRQALRDQDVVADREQKLIVDMAKQFQAALDAYEKTILPKLKALKAVDGVDKDQIDSLEKAPKHAERTVEQYLNIISKLPHKSLAANPAPPMDKAKEDFAAANKMLADAARTARWLADNPQGTN